jgi:hypothetical protein
MDRKPEGVGYDSPPLAPIESAWHVRDRAPVARSFFFEPTYSHSIVPGGFDV